MPRPATTKTRSGMTPLSRSGSVRGCIRRCTRLARHSLLLSSVGVVTACLDAPPTYEAPVQSPPIILGNLVDPPTVEVQTIVLPTTPVSLKVPFRSIDAGEPLVAIFWRDLDPSQSQTEKNNHLLLSPALPPDSRPLDEQDRVVTFGFNADAFPGCHTVTMHLAHESTYPTDPANGIRIPGLLPATNQFDIAEVTWFFDVQDPSVDPSLRPICWTMPP